jgi:serine/threonine-protein kinase RsbW
MSMQCLPGLAVRFGLTLHTLFSYTSTTTKRVLIKDRFMNATTKKILPATLDHLHEAMGIVVSFAEEQGFPADRLLEIELSLEEALVNIIKYAYPHSTGDMGISCILSGQDQFIVEVIDTGIPFNVLSVEDPDIASGVEDRKVGGLGVYFIKSLMDDVTYNRKDDRNILRMTVLKNKTVK